LLRPTVWELQTRAPVCPLFCRWQYLVIHKTENGKRKPPPKNSKGTKAGLWFSIILAP
jgi:hypothetical protein